MIGVVASQLDVNALDYLNRAGNTGDLARLAVSHLAWELKRNNLWTKMIAFYPMMGDTSAKQKENLISSSYPLAFSGTWTIDSGGALPDGSTAYALTGVNPSSVMSINSSSIGFYSRTETPAATVTGVNFGCGSGSDRFAMQIIRDTAPSFTIGTRVNTSNAVASPTITSSLGLFTVSRTANNVTKTYRNSTLLNTSTSLSTTLPNAQLCLGAQNVSGTISTYSSRRIAGAFIASGLTDAEVSTLYTIIQEFQTLLSRNV
jgi:hypothetical protein